MNWSHFGASNGGTAKAGQALSAPPVGRLIAFSARCAEATRVAWNGLYRRTLGDVSLDEKW